MPQRVNMPPMRAVVTGLLCGLLLSSSVRAQDDFWGDALRSAQHSLLKGKLAEAREGFDDVIASFEDDPPADRPSEAVVRRARQGLLELELIRGEYETVQKAVEGLPEAERRDHGYRILLARAAESSGHYEQALQLWKELGVTKAADIQARFRLGALLRELGRDEEAIAAWSSALDDFGAEPSEDAMDATYVAKALIEIGGRENIERASQFLVTAMKLGPDRPEARTELGLLYFSVYNEAAGHESGEGHLKKVLRENGEVEAALIGLYRVRKSNFQLNPAETDSYLSRALSLNPHSVPALMERGISLLQDRRFRTASQVFERALEINPRDKWVLAHRAAAALLMREPEVEAAMRERALAVDPGFAALDRIVGDHLVALYRFEDAIPYYRRALSQRPDDVETLHGLGKALIYTGGGPEAVSTLRRAKDLQGGFVNPWRNNALAVEDLLAEQYRNVESDGFLFKLHESDLDVLVEYLLPAHREARKVLGEKYGHDPEKAVTVEVFHTWDDFSVRTIGFRGFSALGACFGRFITLVSPVDDLLRRQDFMWAATVWHEYAHVLTLALSKHRVPRWLTEGFSVYEERQRNQSWERGMDRELFDAYHNGDIVPVLQLNGLFRGPRILFGYYQGGLIVEYLSREYGFDKVIELLRGYGEDRSTEELFGSVFGLETTEFDRRFLDYVRDDKLRGLKMVPQFTDPSVERLLTRIAAKPGDLEARVDLGWAYAQRGKPIDAANQVRVVLRDDPDHARGQLLYAELLRRREAAGEAEEAYRKGFAGGAEDFDSRIRFGQLLAEKGDVDGAIDQFQRAKACWPQCTDQAVAPNLLLAKLLRQNDRETEAMMELKAFVQRTGRAFAPRLELAALEKRNGNRHEEAKLLQEAVWIDPFMRDLHLRLGDAYEAIGKKEEALREFRVALVVRSEADRENMDKDAGEISDPASSGERELRAGICLRIARLLRGLGRAEEALTYLDRVEAEAVDSDAADQARELRSSWDK